MSKKTLIIHPVLLAIFPMLFLFTHNMGCLSINSIFAPAAISVCFTLISWLLLSFILKDKTKAALVVSFFLLLFFSYGHFYQAFAMTNFGNFITVKVHAVMDKILLSLWVIIFSLSTYFFVRTRIKLDNPTNFLNIAAATLVVFSLVNIGVYKFKTKNTWPGKEGRKEAKIESKELQEKITAEKTVAFPDIYFIILDAYANRDILKEIYSFQNSEFIDYLNKKGFYVANKAMSNYCQTGLMLSSCLNLVYFDELLEYVNIESRDFQPRMRMIRYSNVFHFLKQRGYKIVAFSSGSSETEIINADIYITPGYTLNEFQNLLINTTPIPSVLKIIGTDNQFDLYRKRILFIFDQLPHANKYGAPLFVFAHIEAPHPPFVFGPHGEKVYKKLYSKIPFTNDDGNWLIKKGRLTRDEYIKAYRDQVMFVNNKLKKLIGDILARSKKPPIIVLCADHGPRSMLVWEDPKRTYFKECLSILNAYYLPGDDYENLYPEISPVNTFRMIFNRYFDTDFELLKDKSYFSTARYPYKFIDVTDEVYPGYGRGGKSLTSGKDVIVNPDLLNKLGIHELRTGNPEKAISLFNRAIDADPNYADPYSNLGSAYYSKGDLKKAKKYFEETLEIDPSHKTAQSNLDYIHTLPNNTSPDKDK